MEMDYVYDAHVLDKKLEVMRGALNREIPAYRRKHSL
jgi:hypothetical protein